MGKAKAKNNENLYKDLELFYENIIHLGKHSDSIDVKNFPNSTVRYSVFFTVTRQDNITIEVNRREYSPQFTAYFFIIQVAIHAYAYQIATLGEDWGLIIPNQLYGLLTSVYRAITGGYEPSGQVIIHINKLLGKLRDYFDTLNNEDAKKLAEDIISFIDYSLPLIEIEGLGLTGCYRIKGKTDKKFKCGHHFYEVIEI